MKAQVKQIIEKARPGNKEEGYRPWFQSLFKGSWMLRSESMTEIKAIKTNPEQCAVFEGWFVRRMTTYILKKGQRRLWWEEVEKHLDKELTATAKRAILEDMLGWKYEKEAPDKFAKHVRKHIVSGVIITSDMQWLLERAGQRWEALRNTMRRVIAPSHCMSLDCTGSETRVGVNKTMRRVIAKHEWEAYWHRRSIAPDPGYYPAVTALRAARLWVPAERGEKRLSKYLRHPECLTWEEHIRLLMCAKELKLIPHKKLTRYREQAYINK
jgi:hypothetical protein